MTAECYRHIRTSVWLAMGNDRPFSLVVTSPGEHEGKTTLAVNLAIAMSQLEDLRVVLIDVDLRSPHLGSIFGLSDGKKDKANGLVQYIEGEVEIKEILHQTTLPNLAVIPAGRVPRNPTEMLHSKQMTTLLDWCKQQGFCVILDAPAILPVVDATVTGSLVSGTIFVVSAEETYREAAKTAMEQLINNGISLLGVVMQKVPLANIPRHSRGSLYHFPKEIPKEPREIVKNEERSW